MTWLQLQRMGLYCAATVPQKHSFVNALCLKPLLWARAAFEAQWNRQKLTGNTLSRTTSATIGISVVV